MKKLKKVFKVITSVLLLTTILCIPFLNVYILYWLMQQDKPTLKNWDGYKKPFTRSWDNDVKITISNGTSKLVTIYEGKLKDILLKPDEYSVVLNTQIKYIEVEDNVLVIRLWNETKINKLFNIRNEK